MKITIDLAPEEADRYPQLLGIDKTLGQLVEDAVTVKRNKEALLAFQREVFNAHDWSIETLSRHLTPDFVDHAAMPGDPPGLEGVQKRFEFWGTAFEAALEDNVEVVGEGSMVAVLYNLHAHHAGEYLGIAPTFRDVTIPGIEFLQLRDGKIAAHWGIYDFLSTAEELGSNLAFVPREPAYEPRHPAVPWTQGAAPAEHTRLGADEELVSGD